MSAQLLSNAAKKIPMQVINRQALIDGIRLSNDKILHQHHNGPLLSLTSSDSSIKEEYVICAFRNYVSYTFSEAAPSAPDGWNGLYHFNIGDNQIHYFDWPTCTASTFNYVYDENSLTLIDQYFYDVVSYSKNGDKIDCNIVDLAENTEAYLTIIPEQVMEKIMFILNNTKESLLEKITEGQISILK